MNYYGGLIQGEGWETGALHKKGEAGVMDANNKLSEVKRRNVEKVLVQMA